MRILVLAPQPLFPLHDGLNLRVYHLFREVARSHEVWILCLTEDDSVEAADGLEEAGFAGSRCIRIQGRLGEPFRHCRDYAVEAERAITEFVKEKLIDVVVAESIYMLPYARTVLQWPLLLDLVDDMSVLLWRAFVSEPGWRERARLLRAWRFWSRYEQQQLPRFPYIAVTSPADAREVAYHAPQTEVAIVPNGVDADFFRPLSTRSDTLELVFTGVMGFRPNELAGVHFYTKIFPRIRAEMPNVRLTIAGKGPTPRLQDLLGKDPSVTVTGYVKDIRPYIGRATVYIAPMVSGAGIKNKILEAWAMARPVVATPMACAGLEGVAGETHFVAKSAKTFAEAVIRLLKDRDLGERVGWRARQLVLDRYKWTVQAERVATLLERISRNRPATATRPEPLAVL